MLQKKVAITALAATRSRLVLLPFFIYIMDWGFFSLKPEGGFGSAQPPLSAELLTLFLFFLSAIFTTTATRHIFSFQELLVFVNIFLWFKIKSLQTTRCTKIILVPLVFLCISSSFRRKSHITNWILCQWY